MKFLVGLMISAVLLSGCTSSGPTQSITTITPENLWTLIWENQEQRLSQVGSIRSKLQLSLTEKKRSVSGTGILVSTPQGMRLELRDPLGRLQYSVVSSEHKPFIAYYPSQNVVYFDFAKGKNYLKAFLKLDLKFSDLRDLWLGILPFKQNDLKLISTAMIPGKGLYEVKFKHFEDDWKAVVNPRTGDLLKLFWKRSALGAEFEFSEFARCCETHLTEQELPRIGRNVYFKNNSGSEIDIEWTEIEIESADNIQPELFAFEIPRGVKKVKIK